MKSDRIMAIENPHIISIYRKNSPKNFKKILNLTILCLCYYSSFIWQKSDIFVIFNAYLKN
jgi:hypothetical protein